MTYLAGEFVKRPIVLAVLQDVGESGLPIILVDGIVAWQKTYPSATELAARLDLELPVAEPSALAVIPLVMPGVPGSGVVGSGDGAACTPGSGCC